MIIEKLLHNNNKVQVRVKGRLGNQMFQYAMARALSIETGGTVEMVGSNWNPFCLDCFKLSPDFKYSPNEPYFSLMNTIGYNLHWRLGFTPPIGSREGFEIEKKRNWWLNFFGIVLCEEGYIKPNIFLLKHRNVYCEGYFQSAKYFERYRKQILQDFTFNDEVKEHCLNLAEEISNCNSVAVHIRLGDYLTHPEFQVTNTKYFENAISYIRKEQDNPVFFIFTDSPDIFRKQYSLDNYKLIPDTYNANDSLYLGSLCKHHIISNSSYSWWMQYLAKHEGQIVIAPRKWKNDDSVVEHIYEESWIKM